MSVLTSPGFSPEKQVALSARIDTLSLEQQARVEEFLNELQRLTPQAIAELIASRLEVLHFSDLQGALDPNNEGNESDGSDNSSLFEDLYKAVETDADRIGKIVDAEKAIKLALPKKHHKQFIEMLDNMGTKESFRCDAAYLLGISVGRRLGGGAR